MKVNSKISRLLLLLAMAWPLASCINEDEENIHSDGVETVQLKFTMSMSEESDDTRAGTWGDDDYDKETATSWECAIQVGKLQVLLYDNQDKYIGQLNNLSFVRQSTNSNVYDILGSINIKEEKLTDGKLSCKLVVLANFDEAVAEQAEGTDLSAIKNAYYIYNATKIAQHTNYIPMWGVQKYDDSNSDADYKAISITPGSRSVIGEIFMLRAMAKIRVWLTDELAEDYTLSHVTLSSHNVRGYIAPAGYTVSNTKSLYYTGSTSPLSFNPYTTKDEHALSFTKEDDNEYVLYVPEIHTTSDDDYGTDPYISLNIESNGSNETETYTIELKQYGKSGMASGDCLDVTRNTIYDYSITEVASNGILIGYKVMPWIEASTNTFKYYFSSVLTSERYKTTTTTTADEEAIAVTYGANNAGYSPWLTLEVETDLTWIIHVDNPSFGFITEDNNEIQSQITATGSQTIKFKLVPRQQVDYADTNRNYRASVFVSTNTGTENSGKAPINSGSNQLPNGNEDEVIFYQVSPTTYAGLQ